MSEGDTGTAPTLSVALRSGGTVELFADRVRDAAGEYPLTQIGSALLVADPTVPPLPNGMPVPAVQLRMSDGRAQVFTPANPHDADRLLDALVSRRPDLRMPPPPPMGYAPSGYYAPPPPPGYAPGYAPAYAPGYTAPVPGYPGGKPDYTLAGLAHLSVFFAPIILPLIVWLTQRGKSEYIARQGKQAFFWHLIFTGGSVVVYIAFYAIFLSTFFSSTAFTSPSSTGDPGDFGGVFVGFFVIWGVLLVVGLINVVFSIIGAVKAFKGEPFSYPLLGGL